MILTFSLEAAFCDVPCIMPFAYDTSGETYGSLYNFPFGNLGMRTAEKPDTTIETEIERILNLSENDYEEEVRKNREYAEAYSMDSSMERFLKIAENAEASKISYPLFYYLKGE